MPKPSLGEKEDVFVQRCIPIVLDEGTVEDKKQAVAICHSMWREASKSMNPNQELLQSIRDRQETKSKFSYGITTADRYVQTLLDRVGSDMCYQIAAKGITSFADVMEKAANTLVYSNAGAEVHEKVVDRYGERLPEDVVLPKNVLMVFRHTLSSPRKDRDGDILRTEGMELDPKMLLLWQHIHTMPIGKMLTVAKHDTKTLDLWSAIVDINSMSHDSAVMIDNGMGRFSHGFRAREFDKVKEEGGKAVGFDIKRCEVMEESLVSVPANIDTETHEVILSLVEGGKLTSPVMKEYGKHLRTKKTPVVAGISFTERVGEFERTLTCGTTDELESIVKMGIVGDQKNENKTRDKGRETSPSEETKDGIGREKGGEEDSSNEEVLKVVKEEMSCPKCGSKNVVEGVCKECGYKMPEKEKPAAKVEEGKDYHLEGEKKGRVLSSTNENRLRESYEYVNRAYELGPPLECKACIGHSSRGIKTVLDSLGAEDKEMDVLEIKGTVEEITVESVEVWLSKSSKADRDSMIKLLTHLNEREEADARIRKFRKLVS